MKLFNKWLLKFKKSGFCILFPNSLKSILFIGICSAFFSCTPIYNDRLPDPKIQAGIAKVEG
jgi:hypothetical protein